MVVYKTAFLNTPGVFILKFWWDMRQKIGYLETRWKVFIFLSLQPKYISIASLNSLYRLVLGNVWVIFYFFMLQSSNLKSCAVPLKSLWIAEKGWYILQIVFLVSFMFKWNNLGRPNLFTTYQSVWGSRQGWKFYIYLYM